MLRSLVAVATLLALLGGSVSSATLSPEARTAAYLATVRRDPPKLEAFLAAMPKGGDLHHHLDGSIYAESYLRYAAADGDCLDATYTIVPPPCDPAKGLSPASRALNQDGISNYEYRNLVINAMSTRNYAPTAGDTSILVHTFRTFPKFYLPINGHWPEMFAEVVHRAAIEHEIYLETMISPDKNKEIALGAKVGWDPDFDHLRAKLDAAGMPALVTEGSKNISDAESGMRTILNCKSATPDVGCGLTLRYIAYVLRDMPPEQVFAQIQLGFEAAAADPRVVSVNPVEPQDDYLPMHDFDLHMRMFAYFHKLYPQVKLAMHAGELFPGLIAPEAMHDAQLIRKTILIGGADRIGHGLDILEEKDAQSTLALMARRHILVEDPIYIHELIGPGVVGKDVITTYVQAGVPVALATDDEGVDRSSMTQTFDRAVEGYGFGYVALKRMVRDSLEHAFLPGIDLWAAPEDFAHMNVACAGQPLVAVPASPACRELLASSQHATIEWNEEVAFAAFEKRF